MCLCHLYTPNISYLVPSHVLRDSGVKMFASNLKFELDQLPPFRYERLYSEVPSNRLVRLLKSPREDKFDNIFPIHCELELAYLGSRRVHYDAVSYAWKWATNAHHHAQWETL